MKDMATALADSQHGKLLRILLVEDSSVDAHLVSGLLRNSPQATECIHTRNLHEALARISDTEMDVILLDLNLGDSSGYETFDRVRRAAPGAAILVLSGSDDEELANRTVREGGQDYLVKGSFDGKLLLRAIRYAVERKMSEEALRKSEATVRAIFENSLDAIVIFDERGRLWKPMRLLRPYWRRLAPISSAARSISLPVKVLIVRWNGCVSRKADVDSSTSAVPTGRNVWLITVSERTFSRAVILA